MVGVPEIDKTLFKCNFRIVATGDTNATIMFFDKRLKLLYWYRRTITKPIRSISFKLNPRVYEFDTSPGSDDDDDEAEAGIIPGCVIDRSEKYEVLILSKIPRDATLEKRPFVTRDFFISECGLESY